MFVNTYCDATSILPISLKRSHMETLGLKLYMVSMACF